MNPQPFIFNAADVNNDLMINVLDVVGTVDIILNPVAGGTTVNATDVLGLLPFGRITPDGLQVTSTWENGFWNGSASRSPAITTRGLVDLRVEIWGHRSCAALDGMEKMVYQQEGQTIVLLFNLTPTKDNAGRTELFSIACLTMTSSA